MKVTGKKADGPEIRILDTWFFNGGPAGDATHWKDYRSAKELARAWCRFGVVRSPDELSTLLSQSKLLEGWELQQAVAEMQLQFDDNRHGNRNADLAGWGSFGLEGRKENFAFTIEAKADEKFEDSVRAWKKNRIRMSLRSGASERLNRLSEGLFGDKPDDAIESLQYQLLPALAGAAVHGNPRHHHRTLTRSRGYSIQGSGRLRIPRPACDGAYGFRDKNRREVSSWRLPISE